MELFRWPRARDSADLVGASLLTCQEADLVVPVCFSMKSCLLEGFGETWAISLISVGAVY